MIRQYNKLTSFFTYLNQIDNIFPQPNQSQETKLRIDQTNNQNKILTRNFFKINLYVTKTKLIQFFI